MRNTEMLSVEMQDATPFYRVNYVYAHGNDHQIHNNHNSHFTFCESSCFKCRHATPFYKVNCVYTHGNDHQIHKNHNSHFTFCESSCFKCRHATPFYRVNCVYTHGNDHEIHKIVTRILRFLNRRASNVNMQHHSTG